MRSIDRVAREHASEDEESGEGCDQHEETSSIQHKASNVLPPRRQHQHTTREVPKKQGITEESKKGKKKKESTRKRKQETKTESRIKGKQMNEEYPSLKLVRFSSFCPMSEDDILSFFFLFVLFCFVLFYFCIVFYILFF